MMGTHEDRVTKFVGRFYAFVTGNTTLSFVQLNPLVMDSRLLAVSDGWQEYRFVRAKARCWLGNVVAASPSVTPGGANLALGYSPSLLTNVPVTGQEVMSLQDAQVGNGTFGSPYPRLSLSRNALMGAANVKWFRRGTAFDDTLEVQGNFYIVSTDTFSARPLAVLVEYEVEFRTPAELALTAPLASPSEPDPAAMARQILELQQVLGIDKRILVRRPAALELSNSADETKESDEYVRVHEPAEQPSAAPAVAPQKVPLPVRSWGSIPNTPASARR